MVRRRHAQLELAQVILFGLVLPEPEMLMEPWLRQVDKTLEDEEIVDAVMTVMRRTEAAQRPAGPRGRASRGGAADAGTQATARLELRRAGTGGDRKPCVPALLPYRR